MLTRASLQVSTQAGTGGSESSSSSSLRLRLRLGRRLQLRLGGGTGLAGRLGVRDLKDIGVRDLVVEPERDRQRWRADAIDQDFQSPRLQGVEAGIGRQREQPGHLLPLDGRGIGIVVLHEPESLPLLNHAQAIEAVALGLAKVFCAEKIVRTVGGDKDRVGAARQLALVVLEFQQAEQVAADGGWRDQRRHEFDVEIVARAERPIELDTGRARIGEGRRHLARGHPPLHHGALGEEVVPGLDAEALEIESRHGRSGHSGRSRLSRHSVSEGTAVSAVRAGVRAARARSTSPAVVRTAARMARALMVAPST